MDKASLELLGFESVLGLVEGHAHTPTGRAAVRRMAPGVDVGRLRQRFSLIEEGRRFLDQGGAITLDHLEDPATILEILPIQGGVLEVGDFLTLLSYLKTGNQLRKRFAPDDWPGLSELVRELPRLDHLVAAIERTFDPSGEIRDGAHPMLGKVRRLQSRSRDRVQEHLRKFFDSGKSESLIQDPYVTSRNDRFVIPVKVDRQKSVAGVVHARSSSGATVFLEPLSAVELNNRFIEEREKERELVRQVLVQLSGQLAGEREALALLVGVVTEVDALLAVCRYARRHRCVSPDFVTDDLQLALDDARHPLLIDSLGENDVVPVTIRIAPGVKGLIISGPNTGGKTLALKTVGLMALMAQAGLPLPAGSATLPAFRQILADIGDHQSISASLSTFSAHILRLKELAESYRAPSLILLDEVGVGTDPVYGSALAVALIDFFRTQDALSIVTTHYQALKMHAASRPDLENACVELDADSHQPTFRIHLGLTSGSSGLEIARRLGLPDRIVDHARGLLTESDRQAEEYVDHLRAAARTLRESRRELDSQTEELKSVEARLKEEHRNRSERENRRLETALDEWARIFKIETRALIKSLNDRFEAARLRSELKKKEAGLKETFRRKIRQELDRPRGMKEERTRAPDLSPGSWVRHSLLSQEARVLSQRGQEVTLDLNGKRLTCRVEELEASNRPPEEPKRQLPRNVVLNAVEEADPELDLIGATVEEALSRTDKFLDRASLSALSEVRLIHGYGKGKLRKAIAQFLSGHPHVSVYRIEGGATVVTLRT